MAISPVNTKHSETLESSEQQKKLSFSTESLNEQFLKLQEAYKNIQESKQKPQKRNQSIKKIIEDSLLLNKKSLIKITENAEKLENFLQEDEKKKKQLNQLVSAVESTINLVYPILKQGSHFQAGSVKNALNALTSLQKQITDEKKGKDQIDNQKNKQLIDLFHDINYLKNNLVTFYEQLHQVKSKVLNPTNNNKKTNSQQSVKNLKQQLKKYVSEFESQNAIVFEQVKNFKDKISNYESKKITSNETIEAIANYNKVPLIDVVNRLFMKETKNSSRIKNLDDMIFNWFSVEKILIVSLKELKTLKIFLKVIINLQDINKKILLLESDIFKFKDNALKDQQIGKTEKQLTHGNLCKQYDDLAKIAKEYQRVDEDIHSLREQIETPEENPFQEYWENAYGESCCEKIKKSAAEVQKKIQSEDKTQLRWLENEWNQIRSKFAKSNIQGSLAYQLNRIGYAIYKNGCQLPKEALFNSGLSLSFLSWNIDPEQDHWAVESPFDEPIAEAEAV